MTDFKRGLVYTLIYLSGCIISYVDGRTTVTKQYSKRNGQPYTWTVGDRCAMIGLSLFSWVTVGIIEVGKIDIDKQYFDKPSKW